MMGKLLSYFPDPSLYDHYVDAYGGSGAVLLAKPITKQELYNDLNRNAYSLYKVLTDPALFEQFQRRAELVLYDEALAREYRDALKGDSLSILERAFQFWYLARVHRGGGMGGYTVNMSTRRGMSKSTSDFLSAVDGLADLHSRLSRVIVRNCDALTLIPQYDWHRCLIYLDPPYALETRGEARYETDATREHHQSLVSVLNGIKHAYVVLSGYDNQTYAGLEGFTMHQFEVKTVSGHGNAPKTKTETIWRNFESAQMSLF